MFSLVPNLSNKEFCHGSCWSIFQNNTIVLFYETLYAFCVVDLYFQDIDKLHGIPKMIPSNYEPNLMQ
jgi:hypothetical protein